VFKLWRCAVIFFPFNLQRCAPQLLAFTLFTLASVSWAQPATPTQPFSPTLQQALEAAWQRSLASRTQASRLADLQTQRKSADRFLAGSPELTLAHRTDRLNRNSGLREWEVEIEAPLQRRSVRQAQLGQLDAQQRALSPSENAEKLKLAGQLRDLLAQARLAQVELETARAKLDENRQLVQDTERRFRLGDLARLDALLAQAAQSQSQAQVDVAAALAKQLLLQWQGLTNQMQWPPELQRIAPVGPSGSAADSVLEQHPALKAARAQRDIALSKLRASEADNRDPMSLALGLTRERSAFGQGSEGSLRLALRVPFGTEQRNAPRLSAARLELDTAEAELEATQKNLQNELSQRQSLLASTAAAQSAAETLLALVKQAHELIVRAWRLGDRSLAERLRADGERFEAEQIAARSRIEVINAHDQLQQALGMLP
jgi:outer membrane protein, heavy metal efflux system